MDQPHADQQPEPQQLMHDPEATEAEAVAATAAAQAQAQQEQQEQERRTALLFPHLAHIPAALAPEALLDAVNEGSVPLVHDLVKRDPGLANHRDGFGQTPLMWAAYKGRADMVGCLLDCGAGVNECETRRARTALYLACEFDHADVVALLLRRGANQRLAAQRGWTVLSRGFEGWTPLIIAGYNGCPAVLRCLLAHPDAQELLDQGDEKGATALWWAAVHNRPDAVRVLLEAGADFLQGNEEGKTPGEAARERGNHECAALLEAAERAYLMTKSRRLSRESDAWARLLHTQLLPSLGLPSYLQARVALDTAALPRAQPPRPQLLLIRSEEEDGEQDGMMDTGMGSMDVRMQMQMPLAREMEMDDTVPEWGKGKGGYVYRNNKQEGLKVQEQQQNESEGSGEYGYCVSGSNNKGTWYAAPDPTSSSLSMAVTDNANVNAATPDMSAAEMEAQEFGDWRWGRPAPHYTGSRSSSGGSQSSGFGGGSSSGSSFGTSYGCSSSSSSSSSGGSSMGGSSFLSRAVSSAFSVGVGGGGGGSSSSSLLGKKLPGMGMGGVGMGVVPDGGDAEAASLDQLLPQAVAHYVNRRMRYDVFLHFRDMLV